MSAGRIAESSNVEILSRAAEAVIQFGAAVTKGTAPDTQVKPYDGGGSILGAAVYDQVRGLGPDLNGDVTREYAIGDPVGVLTKGVVWMTAGAAVTSGQRLALIDTKAADPTTTPTVAEAASGTNPPFPTEDDVEFGYTLKGPWGESKMSPASVSTDCTGLTNYLNVTVPGQDTVPVGTTYLQMYASTDGGTTWVELTKHEIAFADLTDGNTHVVAIKADDDDTGSGNPPTTSPSYLAVGAVVPEADTRDKSIINGTEVRSGGSAGEEIAVEFNLPA